MNALMKKAGRALNLKPHWVLERRPVPRGTPRERVYLSAPGDIEGSFPPQRNYFLEFLSSISVSMKGIWVMMVDSMVCVSYLSIS